MAGEQPNGSDGTGVFEVRRPATALAPVVVASPHSGSDYPADFVAASRLDPLALRRSEDSFVDGLFAAAPDLGAPLLAASFPRAYLDVNREPYELDPAMFSDALPKFVNAGSPRVRMGLGTIARIVANGEEIYAGKLRFAEAQRRIDALYRPYHAALARPRRGNRNLLRRLSAARLPFDAVGRRRRLRTQRRRHRSGRLPRARLRPRISRNCQMLLRRARFCRRHQRALCRRLHDQPLRQPAAAPSRPADRINRALYMDEREYQRKPGFDRLAETMAELVDRLGRAAATWLGAIDPAPAAFTSASERKRRSGR